MSSLLSRLSCEVRIRAIYSNAHDLLLSSSQVHSLYGAHLNYTKIPRELRDFVFDLSGTSTK